MNESIDVSRRVTSEISPYKIINIAEFINPINKNIKGKLSLSICPGKKDIKYNRNLELDLEVIKSNNVQIIVCLLEWTEMQKLNIINYPKIVQEKGILFYHMPIPDCGVPNKKELNSFVPIIVNYVAGGYNVLIHCRSGLGRAGTISACCLCHFNYDGKTAISMIRKLRPGAIQNSEQEKCIIQYGETLLPQFS